MEFIVFFIIIIILLVLSGKVSALSVRVKSLEQTVRRLQGRIQTLEPPAGTITPPAAAPRPLPQAQAPSAPSIATGTPSRTREEWEALVGGKLLNRIGAFALILAMAFFLKYAFDNDWLNETMRVLIGGVVGAVLIGGGVRFHQKELQVFAQGLLGAGIAILYLSVYASFDFYQLVSQPVAFVLMSAYAFFRPSTQPLISTSEGGGKTSVSSYTRSHMSSIDSPLIILHAGYLLFLRFAASEIL